MLCRLRYSFKNIDEGRKKLKNILMLPAFVQTNICEGCFLEPAPSQPIIKLHTHIFDLIVSRSLSDNIWREQSAEPLWFFLLMKTSRVHCFVIPPACSIATPDIPLEMLCEKVCSHRKESVCAHREREHDGELHANALTYQRTDIRLER